MIERLCKDCHKKIKVYSTTQNRCYDCTSARRKPQKPRKPISTRGKKSAEYEVWRRVVAIPYLNKRYGERCSKCARSKQTLDSIGVPLDIDHIKTRGSRPDLKMKVTNLRYLCRTCHQKRQ